MRNVLVHNYFEVDFETVWLVVTRDLPSLEKAMRTILATLEQPRKRRSGSMEDTTAQLLFSRPGFRRHPG